MAGLGELILRVGANIAEFTSATDKMQYQLANLGKSVDKLGSDLSGKLTSHLLGLAAAFVGVEAVASKLHGAFELGDQLHTLSEQTGATVEDLDKLSIVAKLNAADLDSLAKGFKNTTKSIAASLDDTSKVGKVYDALGISIRNVDGSFRSTKDVFDETIKTLSGIEDETARSVIGTQLLGKAYLGLAPTIRNYAEDTKRAEELTRRFGAVSTDTANLVDAFGDDLTLLGEGSKRALLNNLVPAFEVGRAVIATFLEERDKLSSGSSNTDWADALVTVIGTVADSFRLIINLLRAFSLSVQVVFNDIKVATTFLSNPVDAIRGQMPAFEKALADRNTTLEKANNVYDELWNGSGTVIEDNLRKQLNLIRLGTQAVRELPQNRDQNDRLIQRDQGSNAAQAADRARAAMDALAKSTKTAKDELESFVEKLRASNFADSLNLDTATVEGYDKLSRALAAGKISIDEFNAGVGHLLDADGHLKKEQDDLNKILDQRLELEKKAVGSAADYLSKLVDEAGAIGKVGDELIDYNINLKETAALEGITDITIRREIEAYFDSARAIEKSNDARKKAVDAAKQGVDAGKKLVEQYTEEAGALGKTGIELDVYRIGLERAKALVGVTDEAERARINTLYDTATAQARANDSTKSYLEQQEKLKQGILELGTKAADIFVDFLENGTNAFKQLGANLKKYFLNLLAEVTIKPLVINLLANITGTKAPEEQTTGIGAVLNAALGIRGQSDAQRVSFATLQTNSNVAAQNLGSFGDSVTTAKAAIDNLANVKLPDIKPPEFSAEALQNKADIAAQNLADFGESVTNAKSSADAFADITPPNFTAVDHAGDALAEQLNELDRQTAQLADTTSSADSIMAALSDAANTAAGSVAAFADASSVASASIADSGDTFGNLYDDLGDFSGSVDDASGGLDSLTKGSGILTSGFGRVFQSLGGFASGLLGVLRSLGGVGGGLLGGGGGGGLGGIGSLFSTGNSLLGGGGLGGLASSFALSGVGGSLGLSAPLGATAAAGLAETGAVTGLAGLGELGGGALAGASVLTGAGSALVAAIPVVGWALAAAAAIYAIVQSNKKPSPVEGQFAFDQASTGFEDNAFTPSKFGNIGFRDEGTRQFSGEAGQVLNKSVAGLLDLFATRFTDEQIKQTSANLQNLQFPHFSGTFTTEDFLKKYGDQILKQVATTAFDVLDPALGKVITEFTGTGEALTKFIGSLLVFHDLIDKLPADVRGKLEGALDGTQETLDKIAGFATAFTAAQDIFNADPITDAMNAVQAQNQSFATSVELAGESLQKLIDQYDGSTAATTALVAATQNYYNAEVQLLAQLEQVKTSVANLFEDTIRNLQLSVLDNAGKGDFLNTEVTDLQNQLFNSSDPAQIQALADRINQDINQLFGLLTPEEQSQQVDTFITRIRDLNDEVQQRINEVEGAVEQAGSDLLTQIQTGLADAVDHLGTAADTMQNAADGFQTAVDGIPNPIEVVVTPYAPAAPETNG
jgi:ABC-type transporter Mla subunit MlaD